ncbi:MAG: Xaa-Pro peptidase family protein [Bacillota bacterium]
MKKDRLVRLQRAMAERQLDAVVLVPGPNLYYFTRLAMHLSERITLAVVPVNGEPEFVAPRLEATRIQVITGVTTVHAYSDEEGPMAAVGRALTGRKRLGVEFRYMRLLEHQYVAATVGGPLIDAGEIFAALRMRKSAEEIELMREAARIVDAGTAAAAATIAAGVTELEVADAIERAMKAEGGRGLGITVLSGPKGALPHGQTGDRVIGQGELVVVDLVGSYQGYYADITRTFPVGSISGQLREIYEVCYRGQAAARAAARPGISGEALDETARTVIRDAGFGEYFTHRTGHGLGLEVHEEPYIVRGNRALLELGMAFTIEPGIYLPGVGGVRIEDDVVITPEGAETLTRYPRELRPQEV